MHHHHPLPSLNTNSTSSSNTNTSATASTANSTKAVNSISTNGVSSLVAGVPSQVVTASQQRRRKKRPNYGTRTVEVRRGFNGFGFTISGQQPCRLSCIVSNSPADLAGLRVGDFLISVNGLNVSKLSHETVVQLIGNSFGSIRMQIAENYYSDSSDEENANIQHYPHGASLFNVSGWRGKPRYLHHKNKLHRLRNSPQKTRLATGSANNNNNNNNNSNNNNQIQFNRPVEGSKRGHNELQASPQLRPLIEDLPLRTASSFVETVHSISTAAGTATATAAAASVCQSNVANVSAMVRVPSNALEYRTIVGYLGTIEMPKQISQSSKLQTVRSCIRKLRQEKRQPTTVLMIILPDSLRLQALNGNILATYSSSRLNYVSSSSESENRFFGLVTSTVHTNPVELELDDNEDIEQDTHSLSAVTGHISISNSCHVFMVDTKLCDHEIHLPRAEEFQLCCTKDPISNSCLEFPNNSEYVVNLIRSMYTMRILPAAARSNSNNRHDEAIAIGGQIGGEVAHSPQPSNHSEMSTTTSNSDSGIGFHNESHNISDRIVLVDFPNNCLNTRPPNVSGPAQASTRPLGIFQRLNPDDSNGNNSRYNTNEVQQRLSVRAIVEPNMKPTRSSLIATRSCDDVLNLMENDELTLSASKLHQQPFASMDDISLHSNFRYNNRSEVDLLSETSAEKCANYLQQQQNCAKLMIRNSAATTTGIPDKLSPQVYGAGAGFYRSPKATNTESSICKLNDDGKQISTSNDNTEDFLKSQDPVEVESAKSEAVATNSILNCSSNSQQRCWAQSSLRTPRSDKHTIKMNAGTPTKSPSPILQRSTSMADLIGHKIIPNINEIPENVNKPLAKDNNSVNNGCRNDNSNKVSAWELSFERLLACPVGLKTFAEFLTSEYSAENIYFWTACERYRNTRNEAERKELAEVIFNKHLADSAAEPVNVDSQARNTTKEKLSQTADIDLFAVAQKQIFNLMKYDSYQRFIRSDLYKKCQQAESSGQPLPYGPEQLEDLLKTDFTSSAQGKLQKSASNAEDRRRKSLLPWHRKMRRKSRDLSEENKTSILQQNLKLIFPNASSKNYRHNSTSDIHSSRSSLSSYDNSMNNVTVLEANGALCRVKFPDGANTIVQIQTDETVGQLIERLLSKRGFQFHAFEVFLRNINSKSINLQTSSQQLCGKEVEIEQRIAFKIDLPNPKVISVKSKPTKLLYDVIKQILHKYHYNLKDVQLLHRETKEKIDLQQPITAVDGQRLLVTKRNLANEIGSFLKPTEPSIINSVALNALDEITNTVFKDLMKSKLSSAENPLSAVGTVVNRKAGEFGSIASEDCGSETSSIFERLRSKRRDTNHLNSLRNPPLTTSHQPAGDPNSIDVTTSMLPPNDLKPNNTIFKQLTKLEGFKATKQKLQNENQDDLLEGLKRAQLSRLEDQRGTEINFELPDFLKNNENNLIENQVTTNQDDSNANDNTKDAATIVLLTSEQQQQQFERPQPAPRLSITKKTTKSVNSTKCNKSANEDLSQKSLDSKPSTNNTLLAGISSPSKSPPPLPPKPKVLPIKPSNWGAINNSVAPLSKIPTWSTSNLRSTAILTKFPLTNEETTTTTTTTTESPRNEIPSGINLRSAYLEEPSSSFV